MPKPKLGSTRKPRQTTSAPAPTPAPTPAPPGKGSWARNALGRARSALGTTQGRAQVANALLDAASVATPAGRARSVAARAAASPTGRRVVAATTQAARRAARRVANSPSVRGGASDMWRGARQIGQAAVERGRNVAGRVKGAKGGFFSKAVQIGSLLALGAGMSGGKDEQNQESQQNTPTPAQNKPTENKASSPQPTPRSSDSSSNKSASSSEYKVYAKDSAEAKDFRANFAKARKSGDKEFTWEGRKYNTKLKGE